MPVCHVRLLPDRLLHDHRLPDRRFADRRDAGRRLAQALLALVSEQPLVLALPRGGVPVAYEVARALHAPLDVLFVRKLGAPRQPELGLGAIVDGDPPQRLLNPQVMALVRPGDAWLEEEERRQRAVIADRKRRWRGEHPAEPLAGRCVIVVDDGIATGGTAAVALQAVAQAGARRVVLAVPVAPADALARLPIGAHDFVCLMQPEELMSVGQYYDDFTQTSDEEVLALLDAARRDRAGTS